MRWLSPGDYLAIAIGAPDGKARLYKRQDDATLSTLAAAGTALNLTSGIWYEGKVVIDDDPGNSTLQQLRFWVDTDRDGDYGDETTLITTTAVDDAWSGGYAGLYRTGGSSLQQFDDVQIGYDNNGDGDILDAGDDLQVDDNFNTNVITLSYDNTLDVASLRQGQAGNLTDDGVLKFVYDAWNRLAQATRRVDAQTVIGTYRYLGNTWRASKAVTNCGPEAVAPPLTRRGPQGGRDRFAIGKRSLRRRVKGNDSGGNTIVDFYYSQKWQILELRNGSNQATRQFVYGTQYIDEPLVMDVNATPASSNDCDPDTSGQGDLGDRRYAYAQDRNWNVVALLETDDGVGTAGAVAERYAYMPYGEFVVSKGEGGSGMLGNALATSLTGNSFAHQGLTIDRETCYLQNRHREGATLLQRFAQRDPLPSLGLPATSRKLWTEYADGMNAYSSLQASPTWLRDPQGTKIAGRCCNAPDSSCNLEIRTEGGGFQTLHPGECADCDAIISTSSPHGGEPTFEDPCPGDMVDKVVDGCRMTGYCSIEGYYSTEDVSCCSRWRYLVQIIRGGCVDRWW